MSLLHEVLVLCKGLLLCGALGWVSVHVDPVRDIPQFTTVLWISRTQALLVFQVRCLEAHLSGASLKSWGGWCEVQTLHSSGFEVPLGCGWPHQRKGLWRDCVSASPTCFSVVFISFAQCEGVIHQFLEVFLEENFLYITVDLVCQ